MTSLSALLAISLLATNYFWITRTLDRQHFTKIKNSILDDLLTTKQRKQYVDRLIKETSDD